MSSSFLATEHRIVRDEFCILSDTDMGKVETIGSRLYKRRMELGLSLAQVREKILDDHRFEIGETTIRVLEKDKVPNPGMKTLEFLALGLGLDPMEVIGLGLEDPPERESGFRDSKFGQLAKKYKRLSSDQKVFVDGLIRVLEEQIDRSI